MSDPGAAIFIGYRRRDSQGFAGRLADDLIECFGETQIFRDDDIPEGEDFTAVLGEALGGCKVLVVVIGPEWLGATDARGRRRLDDHGDWVRREIAAALARRIWVLPVLVGGAGMPRAEDLPEELAPLTRVQAFVMSDRGWDEDLKRLAQAFGKRIPALRGSPGIARRLGPASFTGDLLKEFVRAATEARHARSGSGADRAGVRFARSAGRLAVAGLKRVVITGLVVLIAWFVLENYASPELKKGVADFIVFAREKLSALLPG